MIRMESRAQFECFYWTGYFGYEIAEVEEPPDPFLFLVFHVAIGSSDRIKHTPRGRSAFYELILFRCMLRIFAILECIVVEGDGESGTDTKRRIKL